MRIQTVMSRRLVILMSSHGLAGDSHLTEGGAFAGQDDHHGDVISAVWHL